MRRTLAAVALLMTVACAGTRKSPAIPVEPFQDLARKSPCAEIRNRLFVIDERSVFWDRQGVCSDNAYAQTLFGPTPVEILCRVSDSIAGPQKTCDPAHAEFFDTILDNLYAPDLGLGSDHEVRPVPL